MEGNFENSPHTFCRLNHRIAIFYGGGQRLLHKHMFAALESHQTVLRVDEMRRGENHGIDVVPVDERRGCRLECAVEIRGELWSSGSAGNGYQMRARTIDGSFCV